MGDKRGNFIEQNIEKAVLVIAGIASMVILFMFVLRSPNVFKIEGKNFSAGQIDTYINEQADKLKTRINDQLVSKQTYEPNVTKFLAKIDGVIDIGTGAEWPVPSSGEVKIDKKYRIPRIGGVNDVTVEHIRAAAYVPKAAITEENYNKNDSYEPNDIDFVTVQANFDAGLIADSFQECFAGKEIPEEWRDASLAKPVFAAVKLQRQRMVSEGVWGEWEDVPRAKIDPKSELFRSVMGDINGLSRGEILVRQLKLSDQRIQASLLQPEPYQIASAEEEWLPPSLHRRYLLNQREKETQEKRDAIAEEREKSRAEREKSASQARGSKGAGGPPGGGPGPGGGGGDDYLKMYGDAINRSQPGSTKKPPAKTDRDQRPEKKSAETAKKVEKQNSEQTISDDFDKMLIGTKDISKLRESVVFWAHDDTVVPGNCYRYRVQFGIFNPVVKTGEQSEQDAGYDDKPILWSSCSDITEPITIPQMVYFFPINVQEPAKAVDVQVCKYAMGYWHGEQFTVKRGEVIGKVAEVKTEPNEKDKGATVPEKIDYTTGALVVDLEAVNDWGGGKNLSPRHYFDILYSFDGTNIARIAAKLMSWPEEIRAKYAEIKQLEKKPKLAFKAWSNTSMLSGGRRLMRGVQQRPVGPADKGGEAPQTMDEMQYLMMYRQGMGQPPPGR